VTGQRQTLPDADAAEGGRAGVRRERLRVARIEFTPAAGAEGDELEARQNATIKEIIQWLQRQERMGRT
jgi:hypothetical protein